MKANKIDYPKCPYCGLLINDLRKIPASLLFERMGIEMDCPKCEKKFDIECRVEISFKTIRIEPD